MSHIEDWRPLPSIFPELQIIGKAYYGDDGWKKRGYVIVYDTNVKEWSATYKDGIGGKTIYIGRAYQSLAEAKAACDTHHKEHPL